MGLCFISYRRDDTAADATALYQTLADEFGEAAIFKDVDDVPLGVNWKEHVESTIRASKALVLLIGPQWRSTPGVELELREAIRLGVPIFPILVRGARMESVATTVAPDLQNIILLNAANVDHASWRRDLAPVIEALRPLIPPDPSASGSAQNDRRRSPVRSETGRPSWILPTAVAGLILAAVLGVLLTQWPSGSNQVEATDDAAAAPSTSEATPTSATLEVTVDDGSDDSTSTDESTEASGSSPNVTPPSVTVPEVVEESGAPEVTASSCTAVAVTNVVGSSVAEADGQLRAAGLDPDRQAAADSNLVIGIDPAAGAKVCQGSRVVLTSCPWTTVPNITGFGRVFADGLLQQAGLMVGNETETNHDRVLETNVVSVVPKVGAKLCRGSSVDLVISSGPKPCTVVPDLVGMTHQEAQKAIEEAGLTFRTNDYGRGPSGFSFGIIFVQWPEPGTKIHDCTQYAESTFVSYTMSDGSG